MTGRYTAGPAQLPFKQKIRHGVRGQGKIVGAGLKVTAAIGGINMDSSLNTAISSIRAHERKLGVTANNVANVKTNGFKRDRAVLKEGPAGDVRVSIHREDAPSPADPLAPDAPGVQKSLSNVDLTAEMPGLVSTTVGYKANLKVVRARDDMIGSLLDIMA